MKLWQAKAHAARLWPTVPLRFARRGSACVLVRMKGEEEELFGRGGSWLEAMRDAALRSAKVETVQELEGKVAVSMREAARRLVEKATEEAAPAERPDPTCEKCGHRESEHSGSLECDHSDGCCRFVEALDEAELRNAVAQARCDFPSISEGLLLGTVMRRLRGRANPSVVMKLLREPAEAKG